MDLLFKRYASPFSLIDGLIDTERFLEFTKEFVELTNEDSMWEVWLHKVFEKSYEEFKQSVKKEEQDTMTPQEFETSVNVALSVFEKLE